MNEERIASARRVARYFRDDCRALRDSLQLEMVAAQYLVRMRDVVSPEGVPVGAAIGAGVIAELERHADRLSHALLRALAHIGTGDAAKRSAEAVARLADAGVGLPLKFAEATGAYPVGAWRAVEGAHEGEYLLFAEFEYSRGARHSFALFVEPRRGGVVKHIGLLGPIAEVDPGGMFDARAMEELEIADAGELLSDLLERSFGADLSASDDFRVLMAAARARAMQQAVARVSGR
jgi:hypothetical protein